MKGEQDFAIHLEEFEMFEFFPFDVRFENGRTFANFQGLVKSIFRGSESNRAVGEPEAPVMNPCSINITLVCEVFGVQNANIIGNSSTDFSVDFSAWWDIQ